MPYLNSTGFVHSVTFEFTLEPANHFNNTFHCYPWSQQLIIIIMWFESMNKNAHNTQQFCNNEMTTTAGVTPEFPLTISTGIREELHLRSTFCVYAKLKVTLGLDI